MFTGPREKNIMLLLTATDRGVLEVPVDGYSSTMTAIRRYNTITYHLRWKYLRERLTSIRVLLHGRSDAEQQVAEILDLCAAHRERQGASPERKPGTAA
jgi:hypothetical protein